MKRIVVGSIVAILVGSFAAEAQLGGGFGTCSLDTILEELPMEKLRKKEKKNLLFMREEEKLARDVYLSLYEEWHLQSFRNISGAERTHMASALVLIDKYELEDPVGDNALGVFTNQDLQALYEDLSAAGLMSEVSGLVVGAAIEELDISDLQRAYGKTNNEDLKVLYQNLMKGSRNHLRAFTDVLERYGESYEPVFLSVEEYQAIVDSPRERGVVGAEGESLCP